MRKRNQQRDNHRVNRKQRSAFSDSSDEESTYVFNAGKSALQPEPEPQPEPQPQPSHPPYKVPPQRPLQIQPQPRPQPRPQPLQQPQPQLLPQQLLQQPHLSQPAASQRKPAAQQQPQVTSGALARTGSAAQRPPEDNRRLVKRLQEEKRDKFIVPLSTPITMIQTETTTTTTMATGKRPSLSSIIRRSRNRRTETTSEDDTYDEDDDDEYSSLTDDEDDPPKNGKKTITEKLKQEQREKKILGKPSISQQKHVLHGLSPSFLDDFEKSVRLFNALDIDTLYFSLTDAEAERLADNMEVATGTMQKIKKRCQDRKEAMLLDQIEQLKAKLAGLQEREEQLECKICFERTINVSLVPCGHRVMCSSCSKVMTKNEQRDCPICRKRITQFVVTFG